MGLARPRQTAGKQKQKNWRLRSRCLIGECKFDVVSSPMIFAKSQIWRTLCGH